MAGTEQGPPGRTLRRAQETWFHSSLIILILIMSWWARQGRQECLHFRDQGTGDVGNQILSLPKVIAGKMPS